MKYGRGISSISSTPTASKSIFGKLFVGYAFAEGWAHYTEEMMMDAGLGDTVGKDAPK